jgi:choice-of-anchor C domain-containing protein
MRSIIALGVLLLASTSAQATINLVVNGSFENGVNPNGQLALSAGDSTSLFGWTVLSGGIDYVDNSAAGWDASTGSRSIELNGANARGGVRQRVFGFIPGRSYQLKFALSANPFETAPRPKNFRAIVSVTGGVAEIDTYTLTAANTPSNMLYDMYQYNFVASKTFQDLQFRSNTSGTFGPVIDAVSISFVPEATTWAMLVVGFGLVGVASRRRTRATVAA